MGDVIDITERLKELAHLPRVDYERRRREYAKQLGMRAGVLDDEIERLQRKARAAVSESGAHRTPLQARIYEIGILPNEEMPAFEKRRAIADLVKPALLNNGFFCRSREDRLYYFNKELHLLFDMGQQKFQYFLSHLTDLSKTEAEYQFILSMAQVEAAALEPTEVSTLAHYDSKTGVLAVSNCGAGVWVRKPEGDWKLQYNGEDDLLFFTDEDSLPFEPRFGSSGAFDWIFDLLLLKDVPTPFGTLTREHQRKLYRSWVMQQFFPPYRMANMIPAFLGQKGSAKTTASRVLGRILVGPEWEVSDLRDNDKGEEAVIASLCNRIFVALDNADSEVKWLENMLARYATGLKFRMRTLYTTNEESSYRPRALLSITSRDPHFKREDVAERLLLMGCQRPEDFDPPKGYLAMGTVLAEVDEKRNAIWGEILKKLGNAQDKLLKVTAAPPMTFRMDLGAFGWRINKDDKGSEKEWVRILRLQTGYQAQFSAEGDPVVEAMTILFAKQGRWIKGWKSAELLKACKDIVMAEEMGISDFPMNPQSFAQRLSNIQQSLETELNAKIKTRRGAANKLFWHIVGLEHKAAIEDLKHLKDMEVEDTEVPALQDIENLPPAPDAQNDEEAALFDAFPDKQ